MYEIDELFSRVCAQGLWHRITQGSPSEKFVGTAHWSISRLFDRSNGRNDRNQNTIHADFRNYIVQGYEIGYETLRADPMACPRWQKTPSFIISCETLCRSWITLFYSLFSNIYEFYFVKQRSLKSKI